MPDFGSPIRLVREARPPALAPTKPSGNRATGGGRLSPELAGFAYRFEDADSARTLLLLHGTGADENDLIPLGRALDPHAKLLSPRGKVLENGMPRFFRRFAEGQLDVEDLKQRTDELVDFLNEAASELDLDAAPVVAVGFSNGANIAASTLLRHPGKLSAAVLFRPMLPYEPESPPDLHSIRVYIGAGRTDPLIDPGDPQRLAEILRAAGADVELSWVAGGHALDPSEVAEAREWLAQYG